MRNRFTLRQLMIAVAVVGLVLGLIVNFPLLSAFILLMLIILAGFL